MSAQSTLCTHKGARIVTRQELDTIEAPTPTKTWYPIKHAVVVDSVEQSLQHGGFQVLGVKFALSRDNARMFSTMDLATPVSHGVNLVVGVRNSLDKSYPLGFCAGSRVFICDNLAFRSELLIHRKHTRFGQDRFREAIALAVQSLHQFKEAEGERIARFQAAELSEDAANSYMLQAFEQGFVSHLFLKRVIAAYRNPSMEEFAGQNKFCLLQAFTGALGERMQRNPQRYARLTMDLQDLLEDKPKQVMPLEGEEVEDVS